MAEVKLVARDGDTLVVKYPEQKISPPGTYSSITIGGAWYTRQLVEGDDVEVEYERVYAFLRARAERHGRAAVEEFERDLAGK